MSENTDRRGWSFLSGLFVGEFVHRVERCALAISSDSRIVAAGSVAAFALALWFASWSLAALLGMVAVLLIAGLLMLPLAVGSLVRITLSAKRVVEIAEANFLRQQTAPTERIPLPFLGKSPTVLRPSGGLQ